MSRRSRRQVTVVRQGEPYIRSNTPAVLPLPDESLLRSFRAVAPEPRPWEPVNLPELRRRRMDPTPLYPAKRRSLRSPFAKRPGYLLQKLYMRQPERVRFCVQRSQRREVLFALNRAGYSGSAPGRYRRTQNSQYRC